MLGETMAPTRAGGVVAGPHLERACSAGCDRGTATRSPAANVPTALTPAVRSVGSACNPAQPEAPQQRGQPDGDQGPRRAPRLRELRRATGNWRGARTDRRRNRGCWSGRGDRRRRNRGCYSGRGDPRRRNRGRGSGRSHGYNRYDRGWNRACLNDHHRGGRRAGRRLRGVVGAVLGVGVTPVVPRWRACSDAWVAPADLDDYRTILTVREAVAHLDRFETLLAFDRVFPRRRVGSRRLARSQENLVW